MVCLRNIGVDALHKGDTEDDDDDDDDNNKNNNNFRGETGPSGLGLSHNRGFTITLSYTTLGRTPLDKCSARRRELYVTRHNTHNRQTSMYPPGFEPAIPGDERPQTHALDRTPTGIGSSKIQL